MCGAIDGADQWFVGDKHFGSIGGNVIAKDHNKLLGRLAFQNYDQIDPGSYEVKLAPRGDGRDGRLGADLLPERRRHPGRIAGRAERRAAGDRHHRRSTTMPAPTG